MRKILLAGLSFVSITLAGQALAFNPQPDPPGKNKVIHTNDLRNQNTTHNNTGGRVMLNPQPLPPRIIGTGAVHANASDADDTYCGTPVPGHPHVGTTGANRIIIEGKTHCNANTIGSATGGAGSGRAHTNNIGSATSGAGSGK